MDRGDCSHPEGLLRESLRRFTGFCLGYPAYLDCAHTLVRLPADELRTRVADDVWLRLGYAMAGALRPLALILAAGRDQGVFADPKIPTWWPTASTPRCWARCVSRVGVGVRDRHGEPELLGIDADRLRADCVEDAMALAQVRYAAAG